MPTFDAVSSSTLGSANTTLTVTNHTCASGAVLWAGLAVDDATDVNASATYNGVAATSRIVNNATKRYLAVFRWDSPSSGTHDLVFSWTGSFYASGGGISYTAVNGTTPNDTPVVQTGTSTSPAATTASAVNDTVIAVISANGQTVDATWGDETSRIAIGTASGQVALFVGEEAGAASVTMDATLNNFEDWAIAAINLNVSEGASGTPLTAFVADQQV